MKRYFITHEPGLGYVFELKESDLADRQAIVFEDHDEVNEFLNEFAHVYENSLSHDWSF